MFGIDFMNIDTYRKAQMAVAELVDAWRIIPRLLVGGYAYLVWMVVKWYTELETYMVAGCVSETVTDCMVNAPSTQHAALVTTVIGMAAAIFALYTNSGRQWNGFTHWNRDSDNKS